MYIYRLSSRCNMVEELAVSLTAHSLHGFKKLSHKKIKEKST